jgi:hypothetical protein
MNKRELSVYTNDEFSMVKSLLSILQMLQVRPDNQGVLRAYPLVMPGVNYSPRAHHLTQELCSELVSSKEIDLMSEVKDMSVHVAELTDYNNTLAYQDRMNGLLAARSHMLRCMSDHFGRLLCSRKNICGAKGDKVQGAAVPQRGLFLC